MLPPVRAPQPERDRRWQRDAYGFGSLPEKKGGNPAVCFLIFMSIRMSQCPLPASESRSDIPVPRRKARGGRLPGQRIARSVHRINFIMISEKIGGGLADTTRRKACRRNARIPQPIEAAPPFPFCGTALYSKKPWHFGTGASRTQSVRTRRNDVPSVLIVEDHALFRSGLKQLIGIEPGLTVAGEAGTGSQASGSRSRSGPISSCWIFPCPNSAAWRPYPVSGRLPRERASLSFPCTPQPGMYARP